MARAPLLVLPGEALVCRGGTCRSERFRQGSGVSIDEAGRLMGVSVNSAANWPIEPLSAAIPNRQIGVTTVGEIQGLGGAETTAPSLNNRFHCVLRGITPEEAAWLFAPVVANPNR
jgi:hypothetical protein